MKKDFSTQADQIIKKSIQSSSKGVKISEVSKIQSISHGVAEIKGLSNARMNELISFKNNVLGMVHTINPHSVGVVLLNNSDTLKSGDKVKRTNRVLDVPVGEQLLGRVINPLGEPLDGKGAILATERLPIEREATPIMHRAPVERPLHTGIIAIDSIVPIGLGQRELILGDRQTGKTAIAVDTIINQKNSDIISIYCSIGQRGSSTAKVVNDLKSYGVMEKIIVVSASADDSAGMQYICPYAATSIAEYFMEKGKDVLIVYDDLTTHARAYRQMSLLLRTPPGREAFPGDIFYIHSRLLERATHLKENLGGGSLTALPIVSTEAGNISAYIPTNIISITDGQIYLSTDFFQKGILPAVDTSRSVSRVGSDAQLPAYRPLIGPLKLFYSQFEELESFARFSSQLDKDTEKRLIRGRVIRKILQQRQYNPISSIFQIAILLATNTGVFDDVSEENLPQAIDIITQTFKNNFPQITRDITIHKQRLSQEDQAEIILAFKSSLRSAGFIQ